MGFFINVLMIQYNTDRDEEAMEKLRPELYLEKFDTSRELENFQNETLRPILKLQHNLLVDLLLQQRNVDATIRNNVNRGILESQLKAFISQPHLRDILLGIIIGQFTRNELKVYGAFSKEVNKRIIQMVLQRFMDSI